MNRIVQFVKAETVLVVSAVAACISVVFVPPSPAYWAYLNVRVLVLLFCLMAVIAGFKRIGIFAVLAQRMTLRLHDTRSLNSALVLLCFFTSMLVTNDVALLTFVPFTILVYSAAGLTDRLIFVIVLQTIAANLGSMLTPVGNPQNLYLYSFYSMDISNFLQITIPVTLLSLVLMVLLSRWGKNETFSSAVDAPAEISDKRRLLAYLALFGLCLATVVYLVDYRLTLVVVCAALLLWDRRLFREVDYGLLATFVFFFVFVGNMGEIEAVKAMLSNLIAGRELLSAVLISQVISNVPAAVLLSGFTSDSQALVLGTNLGGLGTLVASLASLISFKLYMRSADAKPLKYLEVFSVLNLFFLLVLLLAVLKV